MTSMSHSENILDNLEHEMTVIFKTCDLSCTFASLIVKFVKCSYTTALPTKPILMWTCDVETHKKFKLYLKKYQMTSIYLGFFKTNNESFAFVQMERIFSFLESWKVPFKEAKELSIFQLMKIFLPLHS